MRTRPSISVSDLSDKAVETYRKLGLECLFVVGGEGTLEIGYKFQKRGANVIGIPKSIDNDADRTDCTFGHQTAVHVACDALNRLHTTGRSHQRVRIVEKIQLHENGGIPFTIMMVAEGAHGEGRDAITLASASTRLHGVPQLGGVGQYLADQIKKQIDLEVRCTVLGHIQRGGTPCAFDCVLGTGLGSFAVQAAVEGKAELFGIRMGR